MKKIDLYFSNEAPNVKSNAAWLKPVSGGCALYVLDGGWKPLKVVDGDSAASKGNDVVAAIVGSDDDTSSDMTLNGLKKYIDEQVEALG